jgi:hypothetical protein
LITTRAQTLARKTTEIVLILHKQLLVVQQIGCDSFAALMLFVSMLFAIVGKFWIHFVFFVCLDEQFITKYKLNKQGLGRGG